MTPRASFPKRMRLCAPMAIQQLYESGRSFMAHPYRVLYSLERLTPDSAPAEPLQLVISVPKKRFKRAVHRNLLKRRTREAFRLHYPALAPLLQGWRLRILCIYSSHDIHPYDLLESKMCKVLDHFRRLVENPPQPAPHPAHQVL